MSTLRITHKFMHPPDFSANRCGALVRGIARTLCVFALSLATATATLPSTNIPAGPERNCCADMVHDVGNCPPQPVQGMSGSCCNTSLCLHLFLQTGDVRLGPASAEVEWSSFVSGGRSRFDRPPVPPPRR